MIDLLVIAVSGFTLGVVIALQVSERRYNSLRKAFNDSVEFTRVLMVENVEMKLKIRSYEKHVGTPSPIKI